MVKAKSAIVKISGSSSVYLNNLLYPGGGVGLALGDADGDGKDELAYALFSARKAVAYLYDHDGSLVQKWSKQIYTASSSGTNFYASLAFGNLDGNNKEDLVVAYIKPGTYPDRSVRVQVYLFNQDKTGNLTYTSKEGYVSTYTFQGGFSYTTPPAAPASAPASAPAPAPAAAAPRAPRSAPTPA